MSTDKPEHDEATGNGAGRDEQFQPAPHDASDAPRGGSIQDAHLEVILDVPVTLAMEIGRTRIAIRDLLQLNPGSVVKLQRAAGDPMDILVNGCLVARGEVVVIGDQFGVRITDVVSPEDRVRTLR